jgi:hypothetical protein
MTSIGGLSSPNQQSQQRYAFAVEKSLLVHSGLFDCPPANRPSEDFRESSLGACLSSREKKRHSCPTTAQVSDKEMTSIGLNEEEVCSWSCLEDRSVLSASVPPTINFG